MGEKQYMHGERKEIDYKDGIFKFMNKNTPGTRIGPGDSNQGFFYLKFYIFLLVGEEQWTERNKKVRNRAKVSFNNGQLRLVA